MPFPWQALPTMLRGMRRPVKPGAAGRDRPGASIEGRAGVVFATLSLVWLAGCTTTVVPPADVVEPMRIALLDHGRHASLVLEGPNGTMVRYAYGDWGWYALDDTDVLQGSSAVLWPTPAGLGRKELPGLLSPASLVREVRPPIQETFIFTVEAAAADRLVDELDRIFRENAATHTYNRTYDLVFVRHPERYWLFNNSNRMVARWLERLGCRIDGPAVLSVWAEHPAEGRAAGGRGADPPPLHQDASDGRARLLVEDDVHAHRSR
jgi:hypothetical protein